MLGAIGINSPPPLVSTVASTCSPAVELMGSLVYLGWVHYRSTPAIAAGDPLSLYFAHIKDGEDWVRPSG